jgi:ATP-dependent exoDNAse (exonuclease V) beta subunit
VPAQDAVRNGDRWRVNAVDPATGRIAAERLTDRGRAILDADYVAEHVTHGYATTVHTAQGVTADATHAVLGENTTRSMLYVAMTRARDANTAYLYERANESEYGPAESTDTHVLHRGISQQAGRLARAIIATHDDVPVTAHRVAATAPRQLLPDRVASLLGRRDRSIQDRRAAHTKWRNAVEEHAAAMADASARERARVADRSRNNDRDSGIEL